MKFNKSAISIILLYILLPNICHASYIWSNLEPLTTAVSANITEEYTNDTSNPLKLDCGSCILIEQTTGQILYSYNSHEKLRPASVTKLMSILLIMEAIENGKITYDTRNSLF